MSSRLRPFIRVRPGLSIPLSSISSIRCNDKRCTVIASLVLEEREYSDGLHGKYTTKFEVEANEPEYWPIVELADLDTRVSYKYSGATGGYSGTTCGD